MSAQEHEFSEVYDDLIVGGGSAGAVIANRLSEDPARRVLLVEAGPDYRTVDALTPELRNAHQPAVVPGLNWKVSATVKEPRAVRVARPTPSGGGGTAVLEGAPPTATQGSTFDYEAGKVMGGSSAINAVQALRGTPEDFEEWAAQLHGAWSWAEVLPYYKKLEDDPLGPNELHGRSGPMPIRRETRAQLRPLQTALMEACVAHGYAEIEDHNDPDTSGVAVIPKNMVDGVRISTALSYLAPDVRSRPNLTIVSGALVHRLRWATGATCEGVDVSFNGRMQSLRSRRVVLCAGAIHTPAILLRSGVGRPAALATLGIDAVVPLVGVGEGFMDHPVVGIWAVPKPGAAILGEPMRQVLLRYTSSHSGHRNDMHICMMSGINISLMPPRMRSASPSPVIVGMSASLMKSKSRGYVRLASSNPSVLPQVSVNCLSERSDVPPMIEGVRQAWDLIRHPSLFSQLERIHAWTEGMMKSDMALDQAISTFVRPSAHAAGSAKMGMSPDAGAVADPRGRVYGAENLWIGDASLMPMIPSAPTNLTAIMIGEKIADELKRERR